MNDGLSKRTSTLLALAALALASVLLLMPVPVFGRAGRALLDLIHAPMFALLSAFAYILFVGNKAPRRWRSAVAIWLVLATLGVAAELLQGRVGRNASVQDAFANVMGAAIGLVWVAGRECPHSSQRLLTKGAAVGLLLAAYAYPLLILWDVYLAYRSFPLLASFEQPIEPDRWTPLNAKLSRSQKYASDGSWSLQIDCEIAKYSSAVLTVPARDWSPYHELVFDLFWDPPGSIPTRDLILPVIVKVQDQHHNHHKEDRFQRRVKLPAGQSYEVRIPLSQVASAPRDRVMDLGRIKKVEIFTVQPQKRWTLYLDNMRLE
ncbi:MAG: hypothetical protein GTO53_05025 [Planctomycetales bacterium]|nr:hypothetical protein [Planctomycetales bacterium]NIM08515.1 hypothetical protein [Planctomycetales bacterium]NIN07989.1 hypothetical protein [Planctomycetales bacterium]NIN77118.1 hypothetical protein [Planctomycetales bacterium]NIO34302.1 hypothetical protein [Planctomycetales bacterium]